MLTNNVSKAVFLGNGVTTTFPFTFKVWEQSQLLVEISHPDGTISPALGWSVELTPSGGTLTYLHDNAPLPVDYKLVILRNMPFVQEVDLVTGTRFDPEVIESALDRATAERQQLFEALERTVKVDVTEEMTPTEYIAEIRAGAATASASATAAANSELNAKNSEENVSVNAASALTSSEQAKLWAEQAEQDVSSAVEQITAEGQRQLERVSLEGAAQVERIKEVGGGSIAGTVVAFAGTFSGKNPIPLGETEADLTWQICDGTNGTPNLVDKFIYGGDGTTQGTEGGDVVTEEHTLIVAQLASHTHKIQTYAGNYNHGGVSSWAANANSPELQPNTFTTGSSEPHSHNQNLPPHIILAYIMKLPQA